MNCKKCDTFILISYDELCENCDAQENFGVACQLIDRQKTEKSIDIAWELNGERKYS